MEITVSVPDYDETTGLPDVWEDDSLLKVFIDNGDIVITGNNAGLRSLAGHLLALSQERVPDGCHLHFSSSYGLVEASDQLILEKDNSIG